LVLEFSVKLEKDSTRTLSLVITGRDYKKKPAKKYISIQQGMKLRKPYLQFEMIQDWGYP
jgi:hypothetical protein